MKVRLCIETDNNSSRFRFGHHADRRGATVNLNQFRLLRVVGKGAFGKVRIVEKKDTGLTFALKYIRKEEGTNPRLILSILPPLMYFFCSGPVGKCTEYHP